MREDIIYPDYKNSIVNITASILHLFGVEHQHSGIPELSGDYLKKFDNIIFLVVDGMGSEVLKAHLDNKSLFRKNQVKTMTSVFPPTTAAAISSYLSGVTPYEHGIIGWTLYFKEYFKLVDFLPLWDSTTSERLPEFFDEVHEKMHFDSIFKKIKETAPTVEQHYVAPDYLADSSYTKMAAGTAEIFSYDNLPNAFSYVAEAAKANNAQKLFYCYTSEPDSSIHKLGVKHPKVTNLIKAVQSDVQRLKDNLKGTKSLIIVTADHGLIDVKEVTNMQNEKQLWDSIIIPTFPEPRFLSCFVKPQAVEQFKAYFADKKEKFLVFTKEEFLEKELLGCGLPHKKLDDFLGNYIVVAIDDSAITTNYPQANRETQFKAMHAGLNRMEMLIPLILIETL